MKISQVTAREIFNSRGYPTVECTITVEDDKKNAISVRASVPSGASKGSHEAVELLDGGKRFDGKGVKKAIENIETKIAPLLIGQEPDVITLDVKMIELDGTDNKSNLGANAILATSLAVLKAQAIISGLEPYELVAGLCEFSSITLPAPMFNVLNGGMHAINNIDIQEFMIIPTGQTTFKQGMEDSATVFYKLKSLIIEKGMYPCIGDEGGFAPPTIKDEREVLDLLVQAIEDTKDLTTGNFVLGLDIAATQLYNKETKRYTLQGKEYDADQLLAFYEELVDKYPIIYLEDGFAEDDWDSWKKLDQALGQKIQIVGDDLFTTNMERILKGVSENAANSVIIKPNQVGTVTETLQAVMASQEHGLNTILSHRSGETNDNIIVDLAIGTQTLQLKTGGLTRGERLSKYNRLLRIEDELTRNVMQNGG